MRKNTSMNCRSEWCGILSIDPSSTGVQLYCQRHMCSPMATRCKHLFFFFFCREQLVHQLKLDEKEHEEKIERERAKRKAKVQVGVAKV